MKNKLFLLLFLCSGTPSLLRGQVDASFQADTLQVKSFSVRFTSLYTEADTVNFSFSWRFGDGEQSNLPNVKHSYKKPGKYLVEFTVTDGVVSDQNSQNIRIYNRIEVPNVFTPNGDGRNDFLVIRTNGLDLYSLKIYTTSGSLIHEKTAYSFSWDGKTPDGNSASPGVYYYMVTSKGRFVTSGFFHLIR